MGWLMGGRFLSMGLSFGYVLHAVLRSFFDAIRPCVMAFLFIALGTCSMLQAPPTATTDAIAATFFLLVIAIVADRYGADSACFAAGMSGVTWTLFFLRPESFGNLQIDEMVPVGVFCTVGLWTGLITVKLRRQKQLAEERERETDSLYRLTLSILATTRLQEAAKVLIDSLGGAGECTLLSVEDDGAIKPVVGDLPLDEASLRRVQQAVSTGAEVRDDGVEPPLHHLPLQVGGQKMGALTVRDVQRGASPTPQMFAVAGHAAMALHRHRLERSAVEALARLEAERLKASLLASVSHDLRTPLASIKAAASGIVLEDVAVDEEGRKTLVERIIASADRLDGLVSNLLSMSRLEAGAWKPAKELFPFSEIVAGVLGRFSEREASRIIVDLPEDLPLVPLDGVQIEQVVWNLIENAFKYVPGASPLLLRIRCRGARVEVILRDHGAGIPRGEERRIFQKFYRAHRGGERGAPGVGMGLAICREIVEAHGGEITAANAPGGGAVFTFFLPLEEKKEAKSCLVEANQSSS